MAKKLAASTQLKQANTKIEELEKKLKQQTEYTEMYRKKASEAEDQIEQVHQVLDAVPHSIERQVTAENGYSKITRSPVTRMAAWLAGVGANR